MTILSPSANTKGTELPKKKKLRVKTKTNEKINFIHARGAHNTRNKTNESCYKFRDTIIHTCSETAYVIKYRTMHGLV